MCTSFRYSSLQGIKEQTLLLSLHPSSFTAQTGSRTSARADTMQKNDEAIKNFL